MNRAHSWVWMCKPRSLMAIQSKKKTKKVTDITEQLNTKDYIQAIKNKIFISRPIHVIVVIAHLETDGKLQFEAPYIMDFEFHERVSKFLTGQQDTLTPENFAEITTPNNTNIKLDLFKHLHPSAKMPHHKSNEKYELLSQLTDADATEVLKSIFELETSNTEVNIDSLESISQQIPQYEIEDDYETFEPMNIPDPMPNIDIQDVDDTGHPTGRIIRKR